MQEAGWTHNGSVAGLRRLAVQTKETGDRGLMNATRRRLVAAAQPAREAVPAYERAVLPKAGGLNEWFASTPVKVSVLTGVKTAGVRLRQGRRSHNLFRANEQGMVRHPTFGHRDSPQDWQTTDVPSGFWEKSLGPVQAGVAVAMIGVLEETAIEAGFR